MIDLISNKTVFKNTISKEVNYNFEGIQYYPFDDVIIKDFNMTSNTFQYFKYDIYFTITNGVNYSAKITNHRVIYYNSDDEIPIIDVGSMVTTIAGDANGNELNLTKFNDGTVRFFTDFNNNYGALTSDNVINYSIKITTYEP